MRFRTDHRHHETEQTLNYAQIPIGSRSRVVGLACARGRWTSSCLKLLTGLVLIWSMEDPDFPKQAALLYFYYS